jgi:hypothetical protein
MLVDATTRLRVRIPSHTLTFDLRSDNQRIVPSQPKLGSNQQCLSTQSRRGMYHQEWTKCGRQILFRVWAAHGLCKATQRNVKELLHHKSTKNIACGRIVHTGPPAPLHCATASSPKESNAPLTHEEIFTHREFSL